MAVVEVGVVTSQVQRVAQAAAVQAIHLVLVSQAQLIQAAAVVVLAQAVL
jgi:hypothetical protein